MSTAATTFSAGDVVMVRHVDAGVPQPEYAGTIVRYWRNGAWIVREPAYGTTCAYPAGELTLAEAAL
jgi:hypothetical protein